MGRGSNLLLQRFLRTKIRPNRCSKIKQWIRNCKKDHLNSHNSKLNIIKSKMNISEIIRIFSLISLVNIVSSEFTPEDCRLLGFTKANLLCSTCDKLPGFELTDAYEQCKECCLKDDDDGSSLKRYPKAILEVCTCKFGAYPQIQAFIKSDRPSKFKNLQIKYVRGLDPIIKLLDEDGKVEDELDIHKWDTDSVDEFLTTHLDIDM